LKEKYEEQQEKDLRHIDDLNQDIDELKNDKECLTRAIDSIQEELLDARANFNKEKKQYEQEIDFFKQLVCKNEKEYQDEINDLTEKLKNISQEKHQLENESNKVRFDFNYLESRITQFQDTIYKLESRNEKLEKDLEIAKEQNKDLLTQNIKSQYETLLHDKNQEILNFKVKDKENSLKIRELQNLIEESQTQRDNEIKNQLSYSNSYSEISETEIQQQIISPRGHQRYYRNEQTSPKKEKHHEAITSARLYSSKDDDGAYALSTLNSDIRKITTRYNDIKYKYDNIQQNHH